MSKQGGLCKFVKSKRWILRAFKPFFEKTFGKKGRVLTKRVSFWHACENEGCSIKGVHKVLLKSCQNKGCFVKTAIFSNFLKLDYFLKCI